MRFAIHVVLHALVPAAAAWAFWRATWWRAFALLAGANLIDLDHLLSTPVLNPDRCSIAAHPLHHPIAIAAYAALTLWRPTRLVAVGLLIHMALDGLDCALM